MNRALPWILGALALVLAGALVFAGIRTQGFQSPSTPAPTQAPQATESPVVIDTPVPVINTPMPEGPATAPQSACSPLSISDFNQKWSSTPVDNPGPLMVKLDEWFDQGGYQCGGASATGNWNVPAGTILWTDLKHLEVTPADGGTLKDGDIVRLRCQGDWCVYAVYREVTVPTPGRYAILERWLDPANDLTGW